MDHAVDNKENNGPVLPDLDVLEAELAREKYKKRYTNVLKNTVFSLVVIAAAAALADALEAEGRTGTLLFPVLQISGTSMTPSLYDEDVVMALNSKSYKTGDVVAFYFNNNILVKRVIAGPGDWVDIDEAGNVSVNGEMLDEPYVSEKSLGNCNITLPYQVPDGRCFVMGDHRDTSVDSRNTAVGCVSDDMIIGRILVRIWPLKTFGAVK